MESGGYRVTDIVDAGMMAGRREAYILTLEKPLYKPHLAGWN